MPKSDKDIGTAQGIAPADAALRALLTQAIRRCPKSRQQIADELGARLGQRITVYMLNDFTSESKKPARFPACFIAPLCEVIGSDDLQRFVLSERLRRLLDFAERELAAIRSDRERRHLGEELLGEEATDPRA